MTPLADARFVVIDTETTGLDASTDRLVELAAVVVSLRRGVHAMWSTLIDPGIPIPPEVSAVHLITDADVRGAVAPGTALEQLLQFAREAGHDGFVAHNAVFDSGFVQIPEWLPQQWICTRRLAQHLWPDAPNYKNMTLRFWRGLNVDTFGIAAHRALGDTTVTAQLLRNILGSPEFMERGVGSVDDLIALSSAPIQLTKWPFGKHYGKPLDSDMGHVNWALKNMTDLDPDLRFSLMQTVKGAPG